MKSEEGFSLIEVLVAFLMTSLTLTVLYGALSGNARQISEADLREATLGYALSHLEAVGTSVPAAAATGSYPNGATWKLEIVQLPIRQAGESALARAVPISVVLEAFDRRGRHLMRLKTYRSQTSEPAE